MEFQKIEKLGIFKDGISIRVCENGSKVLIGEII